MKKDSALLLTGGVCAILSQIFQNTHPLNYIFAGGLVVCVLLFIFASIIWYKRNV